MGDGVRQSAGQSVCQSARRPVVQSFARRGTSPVVGVVLLVGITVLLASVMGAFVAFGEATVEPAPRTHFTASLDATDGWPDGQRLQVVHEGGDAVQASEIALVLEIDRVDAASRLTGFPTRRLTDDNVRGPDVFDNGYAGVDGVLDAAYTDGRWESGDRASLRIAQTNLDVRPGDRVRVRIVHEPSNAVLANLAVSAE